MTFNKQVATAVAGVLTMWAGSALAQECADKCFPKRWVYWGGNLMVTERDAAGKTPFENFNALLPDIKAAGFNGVALNLGGNGDYVMLVDPKTTNERKDDIRKRIGEAVANANAAGLEVIPVGGRPELVSYLRPDLQEAFPTTTLYKADGGVASVMNAGENLFQEPAGFETDASGWAADPYNSTFNAGVAIDPTVGYQSAGSMRLQSWQAIPQGKEWVASRLYRKLSLKTHTAYRISFWLKPGAMANPTLLRFFIQTDGARPAPLYHHASEALGWGSTDGTWNKEGNTTQFVAQAKAAAAGSPSWKQYHVEFNSGNHPEAYAYFGMYGANTGANTVWIDNIKLEEIGISHPVERGNDGDYVVQATTGSKVYQRRVDYEVSGEKLIIHNKDIRDADLKVSWRHSPEKMFKGVPAVACDTGDFYNVQANYYANAIAPLFNSQVPKVVTGSPKKYFMYYDEIQVLNWEQDNRGCGRTSAGDYLGHVVRTVQNPLENAGVETLTWNDMFDPNMNAIARYHQVNGTLLKTGGSAAFKTGNADIDLHPDTVIVNWTGAELLTDTAQAQRRDSLLWFRQYPQVIALYYENKNTTKAWLDALTAAYEKEATLDTPAALRIDGIMYTTWTNKYGDLGEVAKQIRNSAYGKYWPKQ